MTDAQRLLADYVRTGSEEAFGELLTRYIDLVYSTAVRLVGGDTHRAEDVAQMVFLDLALTARSLPADVLLGGWLHRHTCFVASKSMRSERRRQLREKKAVEMNDHHDHNQENMQQVGALLDEAIEKLACADRTAILLRFFERRDFHSVGEALGTNEVVAQKRVSRAVAQLRKILAKRGVTVGASGLLATLSTGAVQSAPIGLTAKISVEAALSATCLHNATTFGVAKTIAMTTIQKTIFIGTLAAFVGTGVYQTRKSARLQSQVQSLEQQWASLNDQIQQLSQERNSATNAVAALKQSNDLLRQETTEIPRLRGELARLRGDSQGLDQLKMAIMNDPTESAAKSWLERVSKLKQTVSQMREQTIPELRFLSEQDWLNAVKGTKPLTSDADLNQALSTLRKLAKNDFAREIQKALRSYAQANNGAAPAEFSQLQAYFSSPPDDALLQRYEFTEPGVVGLKSTPLDDQDDQYFKISVAELSTISGSVAEKTLHRALQEFAAANHGQEPADPSQLVPYVRTPAEQAVLQRLIQNREGK